MSVVLPSYHIPADKTHPNQIQPRTWPAYHNGKKTCILQVGERWDGGYCICYQENGPQQIHCKFFKPDWRCVFEDNFFESDEELFKI
jgi:hypothetical protein